MRVVQLLVVSALVLPPGVDRRVGQPAGAGTSSIPLRYDSALIGKGFPSPVVRLSIGGRDALFLIDTGAGVHTFAAWFVAASGLPVHDSTAAVQGSTGVNSRVRVVRSVAAALEGGAVLDVREAAVVDFPPSFTENGIGGLLSPQLLAAAGQAAVLDLRVPSLRFEPFAVAAAKLPRQVPVKSGARVCHNPDSPFANRLFAVPVRAGGVDANLLLDSGATRTVVAQDSAPGHAVESRSVAGDRTEGVGGAAQITRRVNGVLVERGDAPITLDLTIGGAPHDCGPDGLLGMDALRDCVAVLGDADVRLSCVAPQRR